MKYTMDDVTGLAGGQLFVCATPIGNLEDITLRVLRVLGEVDLIAAEDTRRTLKLLNHYEISTPLTSYHEHNRHKKGPVLVDRLVAGQNVALVSDSGMPGISDPGQELIKICHEKGVGVTICPGASAGVAGLVLSGMDSRRYVFEGFLPRTKKERGKALEALVLERRTIVIYEAPHRILGALNEIFARLGDRRAAVVREITKKFEEVKGGRLSDLVRYYEDNPPRGEFVLVIEGACCEEDDLNWPEDLSEHMARYLESGLEEKEAMKMVARDRKLPKSAVYSAYKIKK